MRFLHIFVKLFPQKAILLLWFCELLSHPGFTQTDSRDFLCLDTVISFPSEEEIGNAFPIFSVWEDECLFTNYNVFQNSDSIRLYRIRPRDKDIDTLILLRDGLCHFLKQHQTQKFDHLAYNGEYIVLSLSDRLLIFRKMGNGQYNLYKEQALNNSYTQNVCWLNSHLLFLSDAYYPREPQTLMAVYDVEKGEIVRQKSPYFNHILCTFYQSTHLTDCKQGRILSTHRNLDAFLLYDSTLNILDSVHEGEKGWIQFPENLEKKIHNKYSKHDAGDIIHELRKHYREIDQITYAFFLDEHKIMTIHRPHEPKGQIINPYLNIWEEKDGHWVLKHAHINDDMVGKYRCNNDTLDKHSFSIGFESGNVVAACDGYLIVFCREGLDLNPIGLTTSTFYEKEQAYFETHNACVQLYIFSHHF